MKKRSALLLASVMAVSSMTVIPAAADEERPTISFFDKNSGIKAFDDRIAEELMNRTGVNIDLVSPTGDPAEKLSLMLAGQDYPDIILMDRSSDIVNKYIEAGALVNLSDYMDKLPNVAEMYGDTLNKTRYTDGNNYYLSNWYGPDPDPVNGFICRYDIMVDLLGQERADSDVGSFPAPSLNDKVKATITDYTAKLARSLHVIGLINIQFIVCGEDVYVIEVNPRSSRTVPYISKVTGIPIVPLATKVILGQKIRELGYTPGLQKDAD